MIESNKRKLKKMTIVLLGLSALTVTVMWYAWSVSAADTKYIWQDIPAGKQLKCPVVNNRRLRHQGGNESGCSPWQRVVFLKTHKTAGSTTASILNRYGYLNNLTFALRPAGYKLNEKSSFNRKVIANHKTSSRLARACPDVDDGVDMLTTHTRYNRHEMEAVVHHAKYITILREPVAQFESFLGFYEIPWRLGLSKYENPIEEFMKNPEAYFNTRAFDYFWQILRNGMLYDLGLDHEDHDNEYLVDYKITTIDREFDLVMIKEYFHESLILLKKLLCWDFEDILYISNRVRNKKHRYTLSPDLRSKILEWNAADAKLYNHFNKTFWRRVEEYGPDFPKDLALFRKMQKEVTEECVDTDATRSAGPVLAFKLNPNAAARCRDISRGDYDYIDLIHERMRKNGELSSKFSMTYVRDYVHSVVTY